MPPAARSPAAPVVLVWGDDDFAVQQRARQLYEEGCQWAGGMDHEILDATASNSDQALRALARLREALQTLPFFGSRKVIWFQNCNFLGEERTATSAAVTARLGEVAQELKAFSWEGVRLVVSAGKVDKRRTFYRTLDALGQVEEHAGLSFDDKDWVAKAEQSAHQEAAAREKRLTADALGRLVAAIGPHRRRLAGEIEKLSLYVGDRPEITLRDVALLVSPAKHAQAFGLAEALGDRDLPRALRTLDEELWEIRLKVNRDKTPIGLLYSLIAKVRLLLQLSELIRLRHLKADLDYSQLKSRLAALPPNLFPPDKRYNPAVMHPYTVSKALPQATRYTRDELLAALDTLLACNQRLVGSSLDDEFLLQQVLVKIIGSPRPRRAARA